MQISDSALDGFKEMYFRMYGEKLTNDVARDYGSQLITLVRSVYGKNFPKRFDKKHEKEK